MSFPKGTFFANGFVINATGNSWIGHFGFVTLIFSAAPTQPPASFPIDLPWLKTEEGFSITVKVFEFFQITAWIH